MFYKNHANCRICNSDKLTPYLDLGNLPLTNNLAESVTDLIHEQKYPLKLVFCESCGLSQLSIVIEPEAMFSHYVYRSSISKGYLDHCHQMALDLKQKYSLTDRSFHVDIAGNDGALLSQFREVLGHRCLNVDPAKNLVPICEAQGIATIAQFWGMKAANTLVKTYGFADLITATNVFAHVDNVHEFLLSVRLSLKPTGVLVMEFPYLIDFIDNHEFDTIYHEHLSYFSIYPLTLLCEELGLTVMSVSKQEIHGGSVRVTIGYGSQEGSVGRFVAHERENYGKIERYYEFAEDVQLTLMAFKNGLKTLRGTVAGFAASAKGNTLLNCAGVNGNQLKYIVDQTPEKIGKFSPGTRIPIYAIEQLKTNPPDYLVILSWNFCDEIIGKCRAAGYKGRYVIPIPEFKVIE